MYNILIYFVKMLNTSKIHIVGLILILDFIMTIETVTVNPLCPTNKIAPHRRIRRLENGRTFGTFYHLLTPGNNHNTLNLQEEPQADESDDCGEIEDYDENDLSSITPHSPPRYGRKDSRFFHNWFQQFQLGLRPTTTHEISTKPSTTATRPPTGGYFGNNFYRPPKPEEPTDYVKPVHEAGLNEPHMIYRPGLVGGPIGHVVGLPQAKPTRNYFDSTTSYNRYNMKYTSTPGSQHTKNSNRPRYFHGDGFIGSFLDLLI